MRILHTSDWHIGRLLGDYSLLEDQRFVLEQMLSLIGERKVDVLLISGDLFDKKIPSAHAVKLLDEILYRLIAQMGVKVLAIGGNHDSPERLSFASRLYRESGFYMESLFNGEPQTVTLRDEFGPVHFHLLPFLDPYALRRIYGEEIPTGENVLFKETARRILAGTDLTQRNVLLAHGFFGWLSLAGEQQNEILLSDSEVSVGGVELVDLSPLESFDYIALGHLHAPQKVWKDTVRYSGSLLKYSVSEASQKKGAVLIDMKEKGNLDLTLCSFAPLRDLRILEGSLEELSRYEEREANKDFVFAKLTDRHLPLDAMSKLKSVYPNTLGIQLKEYDTSAGLRLRGGQLREEKDEFALFSDFYSSVMGDMLTEEEQDFVKESVRKAKEEEMES